MRRLFSEVECDVLRCQLYRPFRAVYRIDLRGSSGEGIDRKSPGVTERVEYCLAFCIAADQFAVLALVDEKACFLSLLPVYPEQAAILQYRVLCLGRFSPQVAVLCTEPAL